MSWRAHHKRQNIVNLVRKSSFCRRRVRQNVAGVELIRTSGGPRTWAAPAPGWETVDGGTRGTLQPDNILQAGRTLSRPGTLHDDGRPNRYTQTAHAHVEVVQSLRSVCTR